MIRIFASSHWVMIPCCVNVMGLMRRAQYGNPWLCNVKLAQSVSGTMWRRSILGLAIVLAACSNAATPSPNPSSASSVPVLQPRLERPSMAYDAARQQVILFGATAVQGGVSETWAWKNGRWTSLHPPTSPPPRTSAGMAYDSTTQTIVLFGGQSAIAGPDGGLAAMADTWTWDGRTWARAASAAGPPATVGPPIADDPPIGRLIMLIDGQPEGTSQLTETWAWDGNNWAKLQPTASPPAPRFGGTMAYDVATKQIVLFGRIVYIVGPQAGQADVATWTFDGRTWTAHASSAHPRGLEFAALAYDDATRTLVHFGGGNAFDFFNDTWTWNGAGWTDHSTSASPSKRSEAVVAYDAGNRQVLLYAGEVHTQQSGTTYYDTWSWDGSTWTLRQPST